MLHMLLTKLNCLICRNHTWIFINKFWLNLHHFFQINITCFIINMAFLWNNLCTLLYSIKIYQEHSLVWYNPNLTIVPFSALLPFAFLEPNPALLKPLLFGVLFLVVLVCFLCMFVSLMLQVEDQAIDRKPWRSKFQRAIAEEHKNNLRWRKASDFNHPSTYALIQEYYKLIGTWRTTQEDNATIVHTALT
jgi:hypothetical protein